jgi:hypothetical protein
MLRVCDLFVQGKCFFFFLLSFFCGLEFEVEFVPIAGLLYLRRQIVNKRWDMNGGHIYHLPAPFQPPNFEKTGSDFMILPIGALLLSERATLPPQRDGFLEAEQSQPGKSSFSPIIEHSKAEAGVSGAEFSRLQIDH